MLPKKAMQQRTRPTSLRVGTYVNWGHLLAANYIIGRTIQNFRVFTKEIRNKRSWRTNFIRYFGIENSKNV